MTVRPFHLAFPVHDLAAARAFYTSRFGAKIGRTDDHWIDFDFYGHQVTVHLKDGAETQLTNPVDGKDVPVRHFGVILEWDEWQALADHLKSLNTEFVIAPYIRFKGEVGEQATMFLLDPSGNALEFKSFKNDASIFAS